MRSRQAYSLKVEAGGRGAGAPGAGGSWAEEAGELGAEQEERKLRSIIFYFCLILYFDIVYILLLVQLQRNGPLQSSDLQSYLTTN